MNSLLARILSYLQGEPVMVGSLVTAIITFFVTGNFTEASTVESLLVGLVPIVFGAVERSQVTPTKG